MEALRDLLTGAASMRSKAPAYIPRIRSIFVMVTPSYLPLLRDFAKAKTAGIKEFDAGSFESLFPELGATLIVSSRSPWRFCGGLLSRLPAGFARCRAQ